MILTILFYCDGLYPLKTRGRHANLTEKSSVSGERVAAQLGKVKNRPVRTVIVWQIKPPYIAARIDGIKAVGHAVAVRIHDAHFRGETVRGRKLGNSNRR